MRNKTTDFSASRLQELQDSGQDRSVFVNALNDDFVAVLLPVLLGSTRLVVERMNSFGHRLSLDGAVTSTENMRVEYMCTMPRAPGEIARLVFQLNACVLSVDDGEETLPCPVANNNPQQENVSPAALETCKRAGIKIRAVERRAEIVAEHLWLQELRSSWQHFTHRLQSAGYNLVGVHLDENSLDARDIALAIHVGMSAIVAVVLDEDTVEA